jgi:radical SAM protein with 4Fe4S-binding SPASM domain
MVAPATDLGVPLRSLVAPALLHVELTTRCPLRCPQCYAELQRGRDIDRGRLFDVLEEAARLQVGRIALSGGEPLVFPYLVETVAHISRLGMGSTMATSGVGLSEDRLGELRSAGIGCIWVSLNGSTEAVHSRSRGGFYEAIGALKLLGEAEVACGINWVARKDNAPDFPGMVALAREYGVRHVNVLLSKPDAKDRIDSFLGGKEFWGLARYLRQIRETHDPVVDVDVEYCYSYLRAVAYTNPTAGIRAGCLAGRALMALDVDGDFIPCRHLSYPEKWPSLESYWHGSDILGKLRVTEVNVEEPCHSCPCLPACRTCRKACLSLQKRFYAGQGSCPVGAYAQ